ncbi:MAG TPA: SOS response-associated peptidase family protein, partial [Beutenbergiaceae bacterium]|nr:SOS response-associated peptidase family protein [Beutenbergiaceae bacterium]
GLFSWWPDPEEPENSPDRWVLTTTILTAAARDGLEEIHEREPVMLTHDLIAPWLDPALTDPAAVLDILAAPGPELNWYPVSRAVGSVRNNSPELIAPAAPPVQDTLL